VTALVYVVDPDHAQYCGGLTLDEQARIIAAAHGDRGTNVEYLLNTADRLADLAITDRDIEWLAARLRDNAVAAGQR
jgi:cation transport protein ChaC